MFGVSCLVFLIAGCPTLHKIEGVIAGVLIVRIYYGGLYILVPPSLSSLLLLFFFAITIRISTTVSVGFEALSCLAFPLGCWEMQQNPALGECLS